jgi:glycerol-3-phosphate dehydrogenase
MGSLGGDDIIFPTKGIHLVLPKVSEQALFVSSRDGRMFFIMPFGAYSLIGTTDTRFDGDLDEVHADQADVEYLISQSARILPSLNISRKSILYTYAGIRPLAFSGKEESKISRKHRVIREGRFKRVVTIAGGKLTTYRNMAKDTVDSVCRILGRRVRCETDTVAFPGGLPAGYDEYLSESVPMLSSRYKLQPDTVRHLIHCYGARAEKVLELSRDDVALLARISPESNDIFAQILYSLREEEARTITDVILRRIHIGITGSRGLPAAKRIAAMAGRHQGWTKDEMRQEVADFRTAVHKDTAVLSKRFS